MFIVTPRHLHFISSAISETVHGRRVYHRWLLGSDVRHVEN